MSGKAKRRNKPKWGSTDPRPINKRPARKPQLDPETGLPPVGSGRQPPSRDELLNRARAKHQHRR